MLYTLDYVIERDVMGDDVLQDGMNIGKLMIDGMIMMIDVHL